jgi:hypothetical protein
MAYIELGLKEEEFLRMTPRQTFMMEINNRRKIERQWEQTREIVTMIHNMAGKVSKRTMHADQYMKLSFDRKKKTEHPPWTKEDAEDLIRKWSN